MNRVEFHYNIADKPRYLQRLLVKVLERDLTALILCPQGQMADFDLALWEGQASFIPHCTMAAPPSTLALTPIWLAEHLPPDHGREVLINLGVSLADGPGPVRRWLELISTEAADAQAGRQRWRHYQAQGLVIEPHDRKGA